jgi:hypothetical protein
MKFHRWIRNFNDTTNLLCVTSDFAQLILFMNSYLVSLTMKLIFNAFTMTKETLRHQKMKWIKIKRYKLDNHEQSRNFKAVKLRLEMFFVVKQEFYIPKKITEEGSRIIFKSKKLVARRWLFKLKTMDLNNIFSHVQKWGKYEGKNGVSYLFEKDSWLVPLKLKIEGEFRDKN